MIHDRSAALPENILYFARALRQAGLPVGPASVMDAIAAVEAAGLGDRGDFRATLHAVLVKKHEHTVLFDQAFDIFWKRRGYMDKLIAMLSPMAEPKKDKPEKAGAGATRVADALFPAAAERDRPTPSLDLDAKFTASQQEVLQGKDFAQMSAAELVLARRGVWRSTAGAAGSIRAPRCVARSARAAA